MELEGRRFEAGLSELGRSLLEQSIKATELMRLGLTRCAMIGIPSGWDSHGDITVQAPRFDGFFEALDELMEHMAITPGRSTPWLIDEVTIVALSEFGRTPRRNGSGGKDHWPFGSVLMVGSGVAGNRVVGATDDYLVARPIDLSTGLPSSSGMELACEHIGTTLMRLGGLDPNDHLPGGDVVEALLA